MRRLLGVIVVSIVVGPLAACGSGHQSTQISAASVRDHLVDAFAEPLWGDAATVRYAIDEGSWGSIEGSADLRAERFFATGRKASTRTDSTFEAYVERKTWWERVHTPDGDAWLRHDLQLDEAPLVTPQLPFLVPSEAEPQPRYVTDSRTRRQVVDALLVATTKLDDRRVWGVPTSGYRVRLSGAAAMKTLPAPLGQELASFGQDDISATFDVWLDDAGRVRRITVPGPLPGQPWTIELWDFGAHLSVARPTDLDRRPEDLRPAVDPRGRTELEVSTGPRLGHPSGDRRVVTQGAPGVEFSAQIIKIGGGASRLEVGVLSRPSGEMARGWTITAATPGPLRTGVYVLGDQNNWTPQGPVGGIRADEALVTTRCTGQVEVRELALDAHGRPNRVSLVFAARCPTDGRDASRQFATSVSGEVFFHSLLG